VSDKIRIVVEPCEEHDIGSRSLATMIPRDGNVVCLRTQDFKYHRLTILRDDEAAKESEAQEIVRLIGELTGTKYALMIQGETVLQIKLEKDFQAAENNVTPVALLCALRAAAKAREGK